MTTESISPTTSPKSSSFGIPAAIVIAGGLIAAAVYFGNGRSPQLKQTTQANQPAAAQPQQPTIGDVRPVTDQDHILGNKNAKVTIVEYSDLECPFCKRFHPTLQQALKEYPNDVRWVYRHFPLEQLHSKAKQEAAATECANEQGKFWEMTDKIFAVTPSNNGLNLDDLPKLAQESGVANIQQFQSCLSSGKYDQHIADDIADAQAAGGQGTPYSVVLGSNGKKQAVSGAQPYSVVKAAIDSVRQ